MAEFDPYLKWLGIRETARPVNHYRLLGLELFESDPEVITIAADRQMAHVRTYQAGPNGDASQKLLNELSRARRCLLIPEKKDTYDRELRAAMGTTTEEETPSVTPIIKSTPDREESFQALDTPAPAAGFEKPRGDFQIKKDPNARAKTKRRERNRLVWTLFGWLTSALAAVGVSAWIISSGMLGNVTGTGGEEDPNPRNPNVVASNTNNNNEPNNKRNTGNSSNADNSNNNVDSNKSDNGTSSNSNNGTTSSGNPFGVDTSSNSESNTNSTENKLTSSNTGNSTTGNSSNNTTSSTSTTNPAVGYTDTSIPKWNAANISDYPVPSNMKDVFYPTVALVKSKHYASTEPTDLFRIPENDKVHEAVADGCPLLGFHITFAKDLTLSSIQPVFADPKRALSGKRIGTQNDRKVSLIAKPGYLVGSVEKSILSPVNCMRVKFMKIKSNELDPEDYYYSDWVGMEKGPVARVENPEGHVIVGLNGFVNAARSLSHFSILFADPELTYTPPAEVASSSNDASSNSGDPSFFGSNNSTVSKPPTPLNVPPIEGSSDASSTPITKLDPPGSKQIKAAMDDVRALYSEMRIADSDYEWLRLAERMIIDANSDDTDMDIKFAMLMYANGLAINQGNAKVAVDAVRQIDKEFNIDFWEKTIDSIDKAEKKVSGASEQRILKDTVDRLITEATVNEEFDAAKDLLSTAITMAASARNSEARDAYQQEKKNVLELKRIAASSETAFKTIQDNENDPDANLSYGDYLFLVKGDVDEACKCWEKSSDALMLEIVKLESSTDKFDGASLLELAKGWQNAGEKSRNLRKRRFLERALTIYEAAESRLKGIKNREASNAIRDIKEKLAK